MITLLLDEPAAIRKIDKSDMLSAMQNTPNRLLPPPDAESTCQLDNEPPAVVVLAGLGGSAIAGDVLVDYCREQTHLPITVCRTVDIPKFVGKTTLFVAISYSGDTQETLKMVEKAKNSHANLAVISSGGKLLQEARSASIPYVKVAPSMPPRVALPELVSALLHVFGQAGVLYEVDRLRDSASQATRSLVDSVKLAVPLAQNPAKQVASSLAGHLPLLIGSEENNSVLRRFKNELNENSKVPAFPYALPEAYHNDIEGLESLRSLSNPQPIILQSQQQSPSESMTSKKLLEALTRFGYPSPLFFAGLGDERLGWLLSSITFGDFVSFYLAMLNNVDPTQLLLIPHFKGQV